MKVAIRLIEAVCLAGGVLAALALAILFGIGAAEIVLRFAFATSLSFVVEFNGYLLGVVFMGGLGYVLGRGGHIRVRVATGALPPRAQQVAELASSLIGLAISVYLSLALLRLAYGTWEIGTVSYFASQTPMFLPQGAMALASVTLSLGFVARLLRLAMGLPPDAAAAGARPAGELPE